MNEPKIAVPPRKRRAKPGGHGHHGGAWKIAYADMVTAMMAFFLVMWICGMDVKTRLGIADYFTNPTSMPGPEKPSSWFSIPAGGKPAMSQGDLERSQERGGEPESEGVYRKTPPPVSNFTKEDAERLAKIMRTILASSRQNDNFGAWVIIEVGDHAFRLEFIDAGKGRFFEQGTASWTTQGKALAEQLIGALGLGGLQIACEGHVIEDAPCHLSSRFHLGMEMAMALREVLVRRGLPGRNLLRVSSVGWSQLRYDDPTDVRNIRAVLELPYRTGE